MEHSIYTPTNEFCYTLSEGIFPLIVDPYRVYGMVRSKGSNLLASPVLFNTDTKEPFLCQELVHRTIHSS